MTDLLEHAVAMARELDASAQDRLAHLMLEVAGAEGAMHVLSEDEQAALSPGRLEASKGEFVADADMKALFAKHRS